MLSGSGETTSVGLASVLMVVLPVTRGYGAAIRAGLASPSPSKQMLSGSGETTAVGLKRDSQDWLWSMWSMWSMLFELLIGKKDFFPFPYFFYFHIIS
jgi:hypothetical protein